MYIITTYTYTVRCILYIVQYMCTSYIYSHTYSVVQAHIGQIT